MTQSTDLTRGKIVPQLLRYSMPLVASSLLQAMYGMVDMVVTGHFVGAGGISGITNATSILTMLTQILIGITTGGNILIGQYFGAGEKANCHKSTQTLIVLSVAMGAALSVVFYIFSSAMLSVIGAPSMEDAVPYLRTCSVGILFISGYNGAAAALRAVGNSRAPLICIAVTSVVNVVLDLIFVGAMSMGTRGAALATVIAQGMSFIIAMAVIFKDRDIFGVSLKTLRLHGRMLKTTLRLGIPCAVQMSVAGLSWLTVATLINSYGVEVSAGLGVSNKIKDLCQLLIAAMSTASTSMVAQNIGAGDCDRARKVMYTTMKITVAVSIAAIILIQLFAPMLIGLFTDDPGTAAAAEKNLRIEIIGQIFYASFMVYHSLALGAGNTWYVFFSSFLNCILVRLILAGILNRYLGATGIYLACMIAPASSVPLGLWYERSNRWRRTIIA